MKKILFSLITTTLLAGCMQNDPLPYKESKGFAQGTTYAIKYQYKGDLAPQIDSILAAFDESLSNFNPKSLLSKVNRNETMDLDTLFINCYNLSREVYTLTDSLFDPTLRPLISAYGFGPDRAPRDLTKYEIDSLLKLTGLHKTSIEKSRLKKQHPNLTLDFSAIAQGYSADVIANHFRKLGIKNFLIEIGGEIIADGFNASGSVWRVGVDKPIEGNIVPGQELQTIIELSNRGLATSGNYRKFIESPAGNHYTHTIDPRTGTPASHSLLSVTIIAPTAALADGYATACMVGGLEWTRKFIEQNPKLQAYVVYSQNDAMKAEKIGL